MEIHKQYVVDEHNHPIAVQIPIAEFERIEEALENYGLAQLMDETRDEELLAGDAALEYYQAVKNELDG